MNLKKIAIVLLLVFFLLPAGKIMAQSSNTGFVPGNIWYLKDPFEEGDKIKIYTFIFNPDSRELSGTVIFFDKTVLLGKKNFAVPGKTAKDVSIDWTATAGDHEIFGKIENAKFLNEAGKYEEVYLAGNETERSSRTVSKKIISEKTTAGVKTDTAPFSGITKTIAEKTPDFIVQPISTALSKLEDWREGAKTTSDNKKAEVKKDIEALDKTKISPKTIQSANPLIKPFKYAELFFFSLGSFIFNNKIVFYGLIIIIVFFILRFIWKKIF